MLAGRLLYGPLASSPDTHLDTHTHLIIMIVMSMRSFNLHEVCTKVFRNEDCGYCGIIMCRLCGWMDGIGMVIIGQRCSKSAFGANIGGSNGTLRLEKHGSKPSFLGRPLITKWGKCRMHKAVEHHSIDSSKKMLLTFTLTFYSDQLKFVSILKCGVLCNLKDDLVIAC